MAHLSEKVNTIENMLYINIESVLQCIDPVGKDGALSWSKSLRIFLDSLEVLNMLFETKLIYKSHHGSDN